MERIDCKGFDAKFCSGCPYVKSVNKEYKDSVEKEALAGNVQAQCRLSDMASDDKALSWLEKSAQQGYAPAQYRYGFKIEEIIRMNEDNNEYELLDEQFTEEESYKWLKKSAQQGHAKAQYELIYYVKIDDAERLSWLKKSAQQGYSEAQYTLGEWYYEGKLVEQNFIEALNWFQKSAKQRYTRALGILSKIYCKSGQAYYNGIGMEQNYTEALRLFKEAAKLDSDSEAQCYIGIMYCKGQGVEQSYAEGLSQLKKIGIIFKYGRIKEPIKSLDEIKKKYGEINEGISETMAIIDDILAELQGTPLAEAALLRLNTIQKNEI